MQPGQSLSGSFQDSIWLMVSVNFRFLIVLPFFCTVFRYFLAFTKKHGLVIYVAFFFFLWIYKFWQWRFACWRNSKLYTSAKKERAHTHAIFQTRVQGCRPPPLIESTTGLAPLTMEAQFCNCCQLIQLILRPSNFRKRELGQNTLHFFRLEQLL